MKRLNPVYGSPISIEYMPIIARVLYRVMFNKGVHGRFTGAVSLEHAEPLGWYLIHSAYL